MWEGWLVWTSSTFLGWHCISTWFEREVGVVLTYSKCFDTSFAVMYKVTYLWGVMSQYISHIFFQCTRVLQIKCSTVRKLCVKTQGCYSQASGFYPSLAWQANEVYWWKMWENSHYGSTEEDQIRSDSFSLSTCASILVTAFSLGKLEKIILTIFTPKWEQQ